MDFDRCTQMKLSCKSAISQARKIELFTFCPLPPTPLPEDFLQGQCKRRRHFTYVLLITLACTQSK